MELVSLISLKEKVVLLEQGFGKFENEKLEFRLSTEFNSELGRIFIPTGL
jgi:hypothetical protein